jgi:hypothetical protein
MVSFTRWPLYPQGKRPRYRKLGGPQSRSGRGGEEKNSQTLPELRPPDRPARNPELYQCATTAHYIERVRVKVKLSLCLIKHHGMKTYCGSGCIAPRILDLGTRWRRVVSFTSRPLYPQRKSPWCPLDTRLGGPQSRSGCGGEAKNS